MVEERPSRPQVLVRLTVRPGNGDAPRPPSVPAYSRARRSKGALQHAEEKLQRAELHLAELSQVPARLRDKRSILNDQQVVVLSPDVAAGQVLITLFVVSLAPDYAPVVGDTVHNIRTAFDYVAVALGSPPIGKWEPSAVSFPVGTTPERFAKEVARKLGGAPEGAKMLVRALEPYDGGRHDLRSLHLLDIRDKHRLLLPLITKLEIEEVEIRYRDGRCMMAHPGKTTSSHDGVFQARVGCPGIASIGDVDVNIRRSTAELAFAHDQPLAGQPILPTLTSFIALARSFIAECYTRFPELGTE